MDLVISHKRAFIGFFKGVKCLKPILWVYMWHYDHISKFFNDFRNFEIIFIGVLFGPGTAVSHK